MLINKTPYQEYPGPVQKKLYDEYYTAVRGETEPTLDLLGTLNKYYDATRNKDDKAAKALATKIHGANALKGKELKLSDAVRDRIAAKIYGY